MKTIDTLIRAAYPLIYIVTYEEKRVEVCIKDIASERNRQFLTWSCIDGVVRNNTSNESTKDPLAALDYVSGFREPSVFAFMDLHPFMDDPMVVRKLRELADTLKPQSKTLIIVSPILKLPFELEKQVTVIDWSLPNKDDISGLLDDVTEKMKTRLKLGFPPDQKEGIIKSSMGLTLDEIDNVFARSLVKHRNILQEEIVSEKEQIIRKSGILEFFPVSESLTDVGGMDNLKHWLAKRGHAFSEKAREFGLPQPKGILLLGVQGCGKSLICKASASLWKMPLLRFDVGKVFSGIVGGSEENIRKAIKTAEAISPCILWIDELEKGLSGIQSSSFSDAGTTARVFGTFLTWQQEKSVPVFTIATCNSVENLPPELLRKGRFDEIFFVDLPSDAERKEIFSIHISKRSRDANAFDLDTLSKVSSGFSGAEIEQAVISGMFDAFDDETDLQTEYILKAISDTVPLSVTMKEGIEHLRKWAATRAIPASEAVTITNENVRNVEI